MSLRSIQAWKAYFLYSLVFLLVFVPVYLGGNALTARREWALPLYLGAERAIPFIPGFIWIYASLFLLWRFQPLIWDARAIRHLAGQLMASTLIAGTCFLLLPGHLAWVREVPADPLLGAIYRNLFAVDHPHNLVPSLHVASSALILGAFADRTQNSLLRLCWGLWLALIAFSTLFTHQHHLLDVATGLGLAVALRLPYTETRIDHLFGVIEKRLKWPGSLNVGSEGG